MTILITFPTDINNLKAGGGVCIIKNSDTINAVSISLPAKYINLEICVVDILTESRSRPIRLFNCYRAPSTNRNVDAINYINDMCNCITSLIPANNPVLIVGDFNFPTRPIKTGQLITA